MFATAVINFHVKGDGIGLKFLKLLKLHMQLFFLSPVAMWSQKSVLIVIILITFLQLRSKNPRMRLMLRHAYSELAQRRVNRKEKVSVLPLPRSSKNRGSYIKPRQS